MKVEILHNFTLRPRRPDERLGGCFFGAWKVVRAGNMASSSGNSDYSLAATIILSDYSSTTTDGGNVISNISSADFDGDGTMDLVIANYSLHGSAKALDRILVYTKLLDSPQPTVFTYVVPGDDYGDRVTGNHFFLLASDFTGNGKAEIVFRVVDDIATVKYFMISNENGLEPISGGGLNYDPSGKRLETDVLDVDGDGKSELISITGNAVHEARIFNWNPLSKSFGYLFTEYAISSWHVRCYGDFNGDGKTDILFRENEWGDLNNNNMPWKILTSTGTAFVAKPFEFSHQPDIYKGDHGGHFHDQIIIADYNGDGKDDILHGWYNTRELDMYYSKGESFQASQHYSFTGTGVFVSPIRFPLDGNGDGQAELFFREIVGYDAKVLEFKANGTEKLLERVKNGIGSEVEFEYRRMSNQGLYTPEQQDLAYPFQEIIGTSLPLVFKYKEDVGVGQKVMEYRYYGAVLHKTGKGFLGFNRIYCQSFTDLNPDCTRMTINKYNLFLNTGSMSLLRSTQFNPKANEVLNVTRYNIIQENLGNKRFFYKTIHIRFNDFLLEQYTDTKSEIDVNGNQIENVIAKGSGCYSFSDVTNAIETRTTTTTYKAVGTSIPAYPEVVTKTVERGDEAAFTVKTKYEYTSKGQVKKLINRFGQPKATTTEFWYNDLGNQSEAKTVSASNVQLKYQKQEYDEKGRYAEKKWNILGQESIASYDNVWGKPSSSIGVDGLERTYAYDSFGRIKTTELVTEDITVTDSWGWGTTTTTTTDQVYYHLVDSPGSPNVKTWYDRFGRESKKLMEGFQDEWITTETTYDDLGRVALKKGPYMLDENGLATGETGLEKTFNYDELGRVILVDNDEFGETSYAYTFENNLGIATAITTVTHPDGKITSKTYDASGKVVKSTDNGGDLDFTYYSNGQVKTVKKGSTLLITNEYDVYGRQIKQIDMNAGTTEYSYDDLDRLSTQINANGEVHSFVYDDLGRVTEKTIPEGVSTFEYYSTNSGASINQIKKEVGFAGNEVNYTYDAFGNPDTKVETIDGQVFLTDYDYDKYGQMTKITYPSNFSLNYDYDDNGYLKTIIDNSNTSYFKNIAMNGYNQYIEFETGDHIVHNDEYTHGVPTKYYASHAGNIVQDLSMDWDYTNGNLNSRTDATDVLKIKTESFTYDNLDRLLTSQVAGGVFQQVQYKASTGNISYKSDAGIYFYHHPTKENAVTDIWDVNEQDISKETQQIDYNSFLQPKKIQEIVDGTLNELEYTYDSDGQRMKSVLKVGGKTDTKYYLGDGCEKTGDLYDHYIFVGGRMIAMVQRLSTTGTFGVELYTFTDHLGSVVKVANKFGYPLYEQNFDAWGRKRNPNTWNYENIPVTYIYWKNSNRGFTGHEHLPAFKLINMNGRMYDPVVGRMLSTDNNIIGAYSTQGYDRYSYALNNPLKYTDPDGEFPFLIPIVGAVIFGAGNVATHAIRGEKITLGTGLKYFAQGAIAGATIGFGIGAAYMAVPGLVSAVGYGYGGLAGASMIGGGISHGWKGVGNAGKILLGQFYLDENKSFLGGVGEGVSRFSYQGLQTTIGYSTAQISNTFGRVTDVEYWGGATFSHGNFSGGSISLGNSILLSNDDAETNIVVRKGGYTFMHEYGHYIQSQKSGWSYLFKYGIPSAMKDRDWTELDANLRSSRYMKTHFGFNWDASYQGGGRYRALPNHVNNTKWWEWPVFPLTFLWN